MNVLWNGHKVWKKNSICFDAFTTTKRQKYGWFFLSFVFFSEINVQMFETYINFKVRIFWEGYKILRNLHLTFVYSTYRKNKVVFSDYMNFTKRKGMCLSRSKVRMKLYFDNVPKYSKFEVEIQICKLVNFYACLTAKSKFFLFHFICLNSYEVQIFWEGLQQYWEIFIQVFAHSLECLKSI